MRRSPSPYRGSSPCCVVVVALAAVVAAVTAGRRLPPAALDLLLPPIPAVAMGVPRIVWTVVPPVALLPTLEARLLVLVLFLSSNLALASANLLSAASMSSLALSCSVLGALPPLACFWKHHRRPWTRRWCPSFCFWSQIWTSSRPCRRPCPCSCCRSCRRRPPPQAGRPVGEAD